MKHQEQSHLEMNIVRFSLPHLCFTGRLMIDLGEEGEKGWSEDRLIKVDFGITSSQSLVLIIIRKVTVRGLFGACSQLGIGLAGLVSVINVTRVGMQQGFISLNLYSAFLWCVPVAMCISLQSNPTSTCGLLMNSAFITKWLHS